MANWFSRLFGSDSAPAQPVTVNDAARAIALEIVRTALRQAVAEAARRTDARYGSDIKTAVEVGKAIGELARDVEAFTAK